MNPKDAQIPDGAFGHWSDADEHLHASWFGGRCRGIKTELKRVEELADARKELEKVKV